MEIWPTPTWPKPIYSLGEQQKQFLKWERIFGKVKSCDGENSVEQIWQEWKGFTAIKTKIAYFHSKVALRFGYYLCYEDDAVMVGY